MPKWLPRARDEPRWWTSNETVYQALSMQGRGGLTRNLADALRVSRAHRRGKGPTPGRNVCKRPWDIAPIAQVFVVAYDRLVKLTARANLVIRRGDESQLSTIVERTDWPAIRFPSIAGARCVRRHHAEDCVAQKRAARKRPRNPEQVGFTLTTDSIAWSCGPHAPR